MKITAFWTTMLHSLVKGASIPAVPAVSFFMAGQFSVSSNLKIEAAGSPKMFVHSTTCCHISEDNNLHTHHCENLNSQILILFTSQTFPVKEAA
jgi:hypothetical protein